MLIIASYIRQKGKEAGQSTSGVDSPHSEAAGLNQATQFQVRKTQSRVLL